MVYWESVFEICKLCVEYERDYVKKSCESDCSHPDESGRGLKEVVVLRME